jgi:hypothetical protein
MFENLTTGKETSSSQAQAALEKVQAFAERIAREGVAVGA